MPAIDSLTEIHIYQDFGGTVFSFEFINGKEKYLRMIRVDQTAMAEVGSLFEKIWHTILREQLESPDPTE